MVGRPLCSLLTNPTALSAGPVLAAACPGGGSLEDLWAFNDEQLARAIAACPLPVVSAVGHEVDFTIADFVADLRAATPSGAAEIVVPDQQEWQHRIASLALRIARIGERAVEDRAQQLDWLGNRLASAMRRGLLTQSHQLQSVRGELLQLSPALSVQRSIGRLAELRQRLATRARGLVSNADHRVALLGRALHSVSPLATLERGYAIVKDAASEKVLMRAADVSTGEDIRAHLASGELVATVKQVIDES